MPGRRTGQGFKGLAPSRRQRWRGFPRPKAQILAFARRVIEGLREAAEDSPNPPVSADELQALLDEYLAAMASTTAAKAAFHAEHARKNRALTRLVSATKAVLRYGTRGFSPRPTPT